MAHLVYNTTTGDVLDGPVTGGGWGPDGIPDAAALVNVPEADRGHAAVLRVDDDQADDVLSLATTHRLVVQDGAVVRGDPHPEPEPAPPEADPDADLREAIAAATSLQQLKDALLGKGRDAAVAGRPTRD